MSNHGLQDVQEYCYSRNARSDQPALLPNPGPKVVSQRVGCGICAGSIAWDCMGKGNRTRHGQPPATITHQETLCT